MYICIVLYTIQGVLLLLYMHFGIWEFFFRIYQISTMSIVSINTNVSQKIALVEDPICKIDIVPKFNFDANFRKLA